MADRPQEFRMNYGHFLGRGLRVALLGEAANSTLAPDSSLYGKHGTLASMDVPATLTSGWVWDHYLGRWAVKFDGTNDGITVPYALPSAGFSVSAWVFTPSTLSGYAAVVTGDSYGCDMRFVDLTPQFENNSGAWDVTADAWHHILWATGATGGGMYVDGQSAAAGIAAASSASVYIGKRFDDGLYWPGKIADVMIWDWVVPACFAPMLADAGNTYYSGLILPPRRRAFKAAAVAGNRRRRFLASLSG